MSQQTPVWFFTAASSGFGHYMALEALSRGHHVIASERTPSKLVPLRSTGATIVELDVTAPLPTTEAVAKETVAIHGYITHLVNAAGYALVGAVEETSPQEDSDIFNANVLGTLNGHRTIANFGSIASWTGAPGAALYYSTKRAVSGLSEALRFELAPFGIAVTVVEPGYFRTGFLNPGAAVQSEKRMEVYKESAAGETRRALDRTDGRQRGDVVKGSKVVVDILAMEGVAEGKEVPVRAALGSDSPPTIREKMEETRKLLDEWDALYCYLRKEE
ncbi:NAD(P)-binding protein [Bimuria novae-zelandiae CBS 107.79]|uniref:NAD(P)-binding protein n=1 Tax=Bimuria novae-zelandiae CBS 107.79 TaxID=1447943 RepID=A0A6A5VGB3_9PLEO|nr:NAD(P)-binding protein [Bimuria novae-zelandiae CBS 107.79]